MRLRNLKEHAVHYFPTATRPTLGDWRRYWDLVEEIAESPFWEARATRSDVRKIIDAVGKSPTAFRADCAERERRRRPSYLRY